MNKDEILKMSQQENKGKPDELEVAAFGKASRVGMLVGALLCVVFVLVGTLVLDMPELAFASWTVYFSILGSNSIVMYKHLKTRSKLICGIVDIAFAVLYAGLLAYRIMV